MLQNSFVIILPLLTNTNKHSYLCKHLSIILGSGVTSVGSGGFVPYPGYEYFRNDLWYFDLNPHIMTWTKVIIPSDSEVPLPRMDPIFLLLGDIIFLHGKLVGRC